MSKLIWVRNTSTAIFELRPLTDYAGQPLKFTKQGTPMSRRCVTKEVYDSAQLQYYVKRRLLEDDTVLKAPAAAPTPESAPEPAPPAKPEPVVSEPAPAPVVEEEASSEEEEEAPDEEANEEPTAENTEDNRPQRRGRRGRNRN